MQKPYRLLLSLYPADMRNEYAEEMLAAFTAAERDISSRSLAQRVPFYLREILGALVGALDEHIRFLTGSQFSCRRFPMRSEFRFPKSTVFLMCVILAGVVLAIEKAAWIARSLPPDHPRLPPLPPMHPTFAPAAGALFISVYLGAIVAWVVLFALKRSGVHRLADLDIQPGQK